jgi:hypothetical protein
MVMATRGVGVALAFGNGVRVMGQGVKIGVRVFLSLGTVGVRAMRGS